MVSLLTLPNSGTITPRQTDGQTDGVAVTYVCELLDGVDLNGHVILPELLLDFLDTLGDVFGLLGDARGQTTGERSTAGQGSRPIRIRSANRCCHVKKENK